jgi:hypothetical protein
MVVLSRSGNPTPVRMIAFLLVIVCAVKLKLTVAPSEGGIHPSPPGVRLDGGKDFFVNVQGKTMQGSEGSDEMAARLHQPLAPFAYAELAEKLRDRDIVLLGDSTMREMTFALVGLLLRPTHHVGHARVEEFDKVIGVCKGGCSRLLWVPRTNTRVRFIMMGMHSEIVKLPQLVQELIRPFSYPCTLLPLLEGLLRAADDDAAAVTRTLAAHPYAEVVGDGVRFPLLVCNNTTRFDVVAYGRVRRQLRRHVNAADSASPALAMATVLLSYFQLERPDVVLAHHGPWSLIFGSPIAPAVDFAMGQVRKAISDISARFNYTVGAEGGGGPLAVWLEQSACLMLPNPNPPLTLNPSTPLVFNISLEDAALEAISARGRRLLRSRRRGGRGASVKTALTAGVVFPYPDSTPAVKAVFTKACAESARFTRSAAEARMARMKGFFPIARRPWFEGIERAVCVMQFTCSSI